MKSDETLMLNYCNGCYESFKKLYSRHKAPIYRFILRQVSNSDTADELHQETWIRIVRARDNYQPTAKFTTYLYTIANNLVIDHYRRGSSNINEASEPYSEDHYMQSASEDTLTKVVINDCLSLMRTALAGLPLAQRNAFVFQQESGHSLEEIAEIMETNRETIKSRLRYAVKTLRDKLRDCL